MGGQLRTSVVSSKRKDVGTKSLGIIFDKREEKILSQILKGKSGF